MRKTVPGFPNFYHNKSKIQVRPEEYCSDRSLCSLHCCMRYNCPQGPGSKLDQRVPWFNPPGSSPCYSSVVPYGSYQERSDIDVAKRL